MAIFDGTHKANMKSVNTRDMGRYMEGEFIYLSNIRYPVSKGNSFRLAGRSSAHNSYPTYVLKGSMVYLTGGFNTNTYYPVDFLQQLNHKKVTYIVILLLQTTYLDLM